MQMPKSMAMNRRVLQARDVGRRAELHACYLAQRPAWEQDLAYEWQEHRRELHFATMPPATKAILRGVVGMGAVYGAGAWARGHLYDNKKGSET